MRWLIGVWSLLLVSTTPGAEGRWRHLSSATNQLPLPSSSKLQTGLLVGDFDRDGTNDFIISFSDSAPALVLYRGGTNWSRLPIELDFLPVARGGTAWDIDGDDDLEIVFGSETGREIWWWENPAPSFDPNRSWTRHLIKNSGSIINRGQIFADLMGNGRPRLAFWNQGSNSVFMAQIPDEPRQRKSWDLVKIFSPPSAALPGRLESLATADINLDGNGDLLAGPYWLKRTTGENFEATRIGASDGFARTGRFRESTYPQVVIAPQDHAGPVFWYDCKSAPDRPGSWAGHQLFPGDVGPIATLAIGDIDRDGNDDILLAEFAPPKASSATAHAWIFYSDGKGNFRAELLATGIEIYDGQLTDLDHDGDLDIVGIAHTAGAPRVDVWLNETSPKRPTIYPK